MINLFQGTEICLRQRVADVAASEPKPIRLECVLDPYESWLGVRQILLQCIHWHGEQRVLEVLEHHAEAASLVLDDWQPCSSEVRAETQMAARLESHLTHNWVVQRPLISGWARILSALTRQANFCLLVPYINFLDWETLATLKTLYSLGPDRYPRLVVGYEKDLVPPEQDTDGD